MSGIYGTCIVVAGMHRSGTSLVAGALARSGIDFGTKLLEPRDDNPKGFYEHVDLLEANEGILRVLGSSYDDVVPLPDQWWMRTEILPFKERIREVIIRDFSQSSLFGFKDPRLCILMPLYIDVLTSLGVRPRFVIVSRETGEIAQSLRVRNHFTYAKSFSLTRKYAESLERYIRGYDACRVTMDQFISDPAMCLELIRNTLWIPLLPYEQIKGSLESFIDPTMKHHTLDTDTFIQYVIDDHERAVKEHDVLAAEASAAREQAAFLRHDFESLRQTMQAHIDVAAVEHESLTTAIAERDEKIVERDAKIAALNESMIKAVSARDEQIVSLNHTLAHRDARLAALDIEHEAALATAIEADRLRHIIEAMERSVTWKAIRTVQRIVDRIMPEGTRLRSAYNRTIISIQAIADRRTSYAARGSTHASGSLRSFGAVDILFVTHEESRTGAPRILFQIARKAAVTHSILIASKGGGGMHEEFISEFGDRLIYPADYCIDKERFNVARETLSELKPRLVYVNSIVSHEFAYVAKQMCIPVLFHVHEIGDAFDRAIEKHLHPSFKNAADVFLAVSEGAKRFLIDTLECDPEKVELVHEFVDGNQVRRAAKEKKRKEIEEELGIQEKTRVVMCIGTFDRRKGADLFVKAAKRMTSESSDVRFVWVGRGAMPHEGMLETMREYQEYFIHVNETRNPFPYMARADVVFLSSREDPFPLVVLEAMALGIPVVVFEKSGGAKEALAGGAGIVVKDLSVPRACEAIDSILGDARTAKEMGETGVRDQRSFEARPTLERIESLIHKRIKDEIDVVSSIDVIKESAV